MPGAGLGLADHVAALEQRRDRLLLDRARRLIADVVEGLQERLGQPEVGEGRHSDPQASGRVAIRALGSGVTAATRLLRLMSLTVVGSIAFDAVETEAGKRDRLLGGAAVHFSLASSFLAETRVVGPVGDDFGEAEYAVLHNRGVITDDVEHVPGGKTFFWAGRYERDVNIRHTLQTDLNVFEHFEPKLSRGLARRRRRCSWPTSSPTCSAPCASSAPAPASRRWTR